MINLNDLTVEDLIEIEELQKLRKEAQRLYNTVIHKQKIPLILDEQNRYKIYGEAFNAEYLVQIDGEWVWQARYAQQTYEVPINVEKIYKMMVAGYEMEKSKLRFVNENKDAIGYFTAYVNKLENKTNKKYRVVVCEDNEEYVFAGDLTNEEALQAQNNLKLKNGAYSYVEEDE